LEHLLEVSLNKSKGKLSFVSTSYIAAGLPVPKGTTTLIVPWSMHMNKNIYPDPDTFDPDRFLPENSVNRHPFAFIPFSAGSRNCIGTCTNISHQ